MAAATRSLADKTAGMRVNRMMRIMAVMELRLQILHIFDICVKYFVMSKNF
jgi:hypothetical protein